MIIRSSILRVARASLLLALVTAIPVFAKAQALTPEQKESVLTSMKKVLFENAFVPGVDFKKFDEFLTTRKEKIDAAEQVTDFSRVVNEALREFGFSHIRLQTPRQASNRNRTSAIGVGVNATVVTDGLRVGRVLEGSPAETAGLKVGDIIVKIDDAVPTKPEELEGEEGKKVKLEVKNTAGETRQVEIEYKRFSTVRKETLTWANDDTAVLRIWTFSAGYSRENIENLLKEAAPKAKNLILDLRSNGGGLVNNLNHLLSLLMPDNTEYGTFISKRVASQFAEANPGKEVTTDNVAAWAPNKAKTRKRSMDPFAGKIAVLINRGSASASEICAAALRECVQAKVVGPRTAGAVLASVFRPLAEGFSLQYPTSDYVTIKGVRLEKNPVIGDADVPTPAIVDGKDLFIEKAIELLSSAG